MVSPQTTSPGHEPARVADATPRSPVYRILPEAAWPYAQLARLDRPIGTWLLLWPCWWSIGLAQIHLGGGMPSLWLIILFGIGAIAMRGAGCTYNDIVDRDFDARVTRTRSRPIPSGRVTVARAKAFMVVQAAVGLLVLLQFNPFAIALGAASLLVVFAYPFMKRVTYWPQFVLGLAFNWGALLGWAAVTGRLDWAPVVLYVTGIAWTLGYDTIYALQDRTDDLVIGVKSTAVRFRDRTHLWLRGFYAATIAGLVVAGLMAGAGWPFLVGIAAAALHAVWQLRTLNADDPARCLRLFRSNRDFGALVFAGIVADSLLRAGLT